MESPPVRIVESPFDRAADVRARSSSALYWLERIGLTVLFLGAGGLLKRLTPDDPTWWVAIIPAGALAIIWGELDDALRIRYGRKRRVEEDEAEEEARELAEVRAGRMHFAPIVR